MGLLPKTGRIKGWGFLSYLYLTQKKPDGLWRLLGDNHKLNQVALPITTAALAAVFYCRNQQTVAYGMQLLTRKMLFPSIPIVKKSELICFQLLGKTVYTFTVAADLSFSSLEQFCRYHLSWTCSMTYPLLCSLIQHCLCPRNVF